MSLECANKGGEESIIRLEKIPSLEKPQALSEAGIHALSFWDPRPGEIFTVEDPEKTFYRARLVEYSAEEAVIVPFEALPRSVESSVRLDIFQALPEKERFELVLQKLTEIGVHAIVPFTSTRSTTLPERDSKQKKSHRWPDVLLRAARQCRRAMIPTLSPVLSWDAALYEGSKADLKLLLYEGETHWSLREGLAGGAHQPARVALFIGPEGGFAPEEVEEARLLGFLPVSAGPRILRTETAAIVSAAILQFQLGDLW